MESLTAFSILDLAAARSRCREAIFRLNPPGNDFTRSAALLP